MIQCSRSVDQNRASSQKQAQVKKQMQLLHMLLPEDGEMDLGDNLSRYRHKKWAKRVVVKRPRLGRIFWQIKKRLISG